jgi:superfamily II DNA or RNA helicase
MVNPTRTLLMGADPRRRFSSKQRVALYLAADGRCEQCGTQLEAGWHADHVHPHSKGGDTDVINGAALCPPCNLKKGNNMPPSTTDPRTVWQQRAVAQFLASDHDFLVAATPGAGKTRMALAAARQLFDRGLIDQTTIVVPSDNLREQWRNNAWEYERLDITATPPKVGKIAAQHGSITTYQSVSHDPEVWRARTRSRTLVIFDEIHHAGDNDWGETIRIAFEGADRRLLLSGTPWRTDRRAIPFVTYDDDLKFVAHAGISFREAVAKGVVRPIHFTVHDGAAGILVGEADQADELIYLSEAEKEERRIWRAMRNPQNEWIPEIFREADKELTRKRQVVPDAGGLIFAAEIKHAQEYARIMSEICGEKVVAVHNHMHDPNREISRFANGTQRWLVAVNMVSEGCDIPRAVVGVFGSDKITKTWLHQSSGRFVRKTSASDRQTAVMFIPNFLQLVEWASAMEMDSDEGLLEFEETERTKAADLLPSPTEYIPDVLWAGNATSVGVVSTAGERYEPDELCRAELALSVLNITGLSPIDAVQLYRKMNETTVLAGAKFERTKPELTPDAERERLMKQVAQSVGRLASKTGAEFQHINGDLKRRFGVPRRSASVEILLEQLEWLEDRLDEAYSS